MTVRRAWSAGPVLLAVYRPFNVYLCVGSWSIFLREPVARGGTMSDPYAICLDALREHWTGYATATEVGNWMFAALDAAGDTTIPRDGEACVRVQIMVGDVMADLGDPTDYNAVVSNALRAACASLPPCVECGHGRPTHVMDCLMAEHPERPETEGAKPC